MGSWWARGKTGECVTEVGVRGSAGIAERVDPVRHRQFFAQSLYSIKRDPSIIPIGGVCAARLIGRRVGFRGASKSRGVPEDSMNPNPAVELAPVRVRPLFASNPTAQQCTGVCGVMGRAGVAERGDPGVQRQFFAPLLYRIKRSPPIIPIGGVCAARLIGRRVGFLRGANRPIPQSGLVH
jgi:hypothetical protein